MNGCDDREYEVTFNVPVTLRVRASDEKRAELSAFAETGAWRHFCGKRFAVGFPTAVTVKEVTDNAPSRV